MRWHSPPVAALFIAVLCPAALGQEPPPPVRINEVLASNVTVYPDNVDFDDYSDWIELHNATDEVASLAGYSLTDDIDTPTRWAFPNDAEIPANGYLVVRADGFDAKPGDSSRRLFSPWASFTVDHYHTNFKLSATGESLALFRSENAGALLRTGATWRYTDDGEDPGADWATHAFDDDGWKIGQAEFGYGENDQTTTILFGEDSDSKHVTSYFRTRFSIDDLESVSGLQVRVLVDDGCVIYINGTEAARVRLPEGQIDGSTLAAASSPEDGFETLEISTALLQAGENTVAVEVHQVDRDSSDVSFDLEMTASVPPSNPELIDAIDFGAQTSDVSFGRSLEDASKWTHFGEPTPGGTNDTFPADAVVVTSAVDFSLSGGFYTGTQTIGLSATEGAEVRYTTDGAWPTTASPAYADPIEVTQTTVIRARTFAPGKIPGVLSTETFFIDEPERTLPVISFVVDPEVFFDGGIGIYRNVFKGREAPVSIAWFDETGALAFNVNAGAKISGENIWRFAQKPMNISLRGKYGDDSINYQLFPTEKFGTFSRFTLRNGGDNWDDDMLRDAMTADIMRGQIQNDVEGYRPVVLYMNGRYWGIHNVRESLDPSYFATAHHVDPDNYDHVEYGHITSGSVTLGAKEGDILDYQALEAYADENDLSDPAHFAFMETRMDMENFMDFIIMEDFVYNSSWRHNREFWRERKDGAKWRWIVPDLDRGLNDSNVTRSLLDDFDRRFSLFEQVMDNDGFKNKLAQRYAAHISSTFHPTRIAEIVDRRDAEVRDEMPRHIARWENEDGISSMESRQGQLDEIKRFAVDRAEHVYEDFRGNFGMPESAELTLGISPPEGGRIVLNGIPQLPEYGNTADLFQGLPADAVAEPAPGYRFADWSDGSTDRTINFSLSEPATLIANFVPTDESVVAPTLVSNTTLRADASPYAADGDIVVPVGTTLTIPAGVTLRMQPGADIRVAGTLLIEGTEAQPVRIESRVPGYEWGAIALVDAEGVSRLSNLIVRNASSGSEPVLERGAISAIRSEIVIDGLDIEGPPIPIFVWEGSVELRNSTIYSPYTGDGINVKHGQGLVENCTFVGNTARDTDAIDFDDVVDGVIRNNRIYAYRGPNSDGIDVGEGCVDLLVSGNLIYNNSDKGISVGQGSTAIIERNLIVGCVQGIGIKDTGSFAAVDQNTFARCDIGVAIFEKNLGAGGGGALVTNTIFSRSKTSPVTVDALSTLDVRHSLSDTLALAGTANLNTDPRFTEPGRYDFSLGAGSPAKDAGDPAHPNDADGTRADIGALYVYDPEHYPFLTPNVVVINEILTHSDDGTADWIELHNTSDTPVDIGGWYLSDSAADLLKYRISDDTILEGGAYMVFDQTAHFGEFFAFSENGETAYLFAPGDDLASDYLVEESFGPAPTGVTRGRYLKSTNTYNFVFMDSPTPGRANSSPQVGPVIVSEINYHPGGNGDSEYIELTNITDADVLLYDAVKGESWRLTDGVAFNFPEDAPVTLAAGERIVLARSITALRAEFAIPETVRVFQWVLGGLSNSGERIELSRPGDVDAQGVRQWVRVDRVTFSDRDGWPTEADGTGFSLTRADESAYGNDVVNWIAAEPTPGVFARVLEARLPVLDVVPTADGVAISWSGGTDSQFAIESSATLAPDSWETVDTVSAGDGTSALPIEAEGVRYFRLRSIE